MHHIWVYANNQQKIGRISGVLEISRKPDNPAPGQPGKSGPAGLSALNLGRIIRPGLVLKGLRTRPRGQTVHNQPPCASLSSLSPQDRRSSSSSPEPPRPLPLGVFGWIGCSSSLAFIPSKRLLKWKRVWLTIPNPRCCDLYVLFS